MGVNLDKPTLWKADIAKSVDCFNRWFMQFAPKAFRTTRITTSKEVETALMVTDNLRNISSAVLRAHPEIVPTLRMSTCPPLARDRLIGLGNLSKSMINRMEKHKKLPKLLIGKNLDRELSKIGKIIEKLADEDIFPWLTTKAKPTKDDVKRAATIVADRLCGASADPIIRNAQEIRQLKLIRDWLEKRGYVFLKAGTGTKFTDMKPGTFAFRLNVEIEQGDERRLVNIPMDIIVKPKSASKKDLPIFIEAKSAGDFTNVNKRRKEEGKKMEQLRHSHGKKVNFILFLCGYFDSGYLGYEAAEGIDWVWEHRIDDLTKFGI